MCGGDTEGKGLLTLHLQDLVTEVGLDVVGAVGGQDQSQAAGEEQMGSIRHGIMQHPWALCGHPWTLWGTQDKHGAPRIPGALIGILGHP